MIKRTLYFGNPAYLSLKREQLCIKFPEIVKNDTLPEAFKSQSEITLPIEDIGVIVLDNKQITLTQGLLEKLLEANCAVITCDNNRMPHGLLLPLVGNTIQTERFREQIEASIPLKKQLWQQIIQAKITNQASVLHNTTGSVIKNMQVWAADVKSGDPDNYEARAAVYYWSNLFPQVENFTRAREGLPPNNLLNYGYAILRGVVARSLVASGLLPTLGIYHRNKYNAYCLADDVMEPYRPFVDKVVVDIVQSRADIVELTKDSKEKLLTIPVIDVVINKKRSPLMLAVGQTTASLAQCFGGKTRKLKLPYFESS